MTNSASTQAQIQDSELTQPSIHPIYELLEHVKEPVPQSQSFRTSTAQGGVLVRIQY